MRRPQPRRKIFRLGELHVGDRQIRVHLLDVSEGGARLHCSAALRVGTPIILSWEGERWRGVIAWSADGRCGVRFLSPLPSVAIMALTAPLQH